MAKRRRARPGARAGGRRTQDILGILLFFLGSSGLLCLAWRQSAPVPDNVAWALRFTAGTGAWAIPVILIAVGSLFLVGWERFTLSHSSYGTLTAYLAILAGEHLARSGDPHAILGRGNDILYAGGVIGGTIGSTLINLLGPAISWLALGCLGLFAVVLLVDRPLADIARAVHARALALPIPHGGARIAADSVPAIEPPEAPADRAARTERVVRGALGEADDEAPPRRGLSLFRRRNGDVAEPTEPEPANEPAAAEPIPAAAVITVSAEPDPDEGARPARQLPLPVYMPPPLTLLREPSAAPRRTQAELAEKIRILEETLEQFNIQATVVEVANGPSVTQFEIQLAPGIKVNKIVSLADNLAMSLAAKHVRVEAPIPGKAAIGIEVPNNTPAVVTLRECLESAEFKKAPGRVTVALGKDVSGRVRTADLSAMPHLLIGGSTNSGKSVCLNTIIASLVYRSTPREVRLLMIDPKRVELSLWDGIPHLLYPVVKDIKQAPGVFRALLREMDRRYDLFTAVGTRNIESYNQKAQADDRLPYIVLIVDELADLMQAHGPDVEQSIHRLATLARATGIHLVIATQRPSVDVITGTIKANISSRIAFSVASMVDSRTILDAPGADRLIGKGDMLFLPMGEHKPARVQGCYLSEAETNSLVEYLRSQGRPDYSLNVIADPGGDGRGSAGGSDDGDEDEFFEGATRLVVGQGSCSTSMIQRRFRIGYTRAARIVELMEERGIVGAANGAKPREILVSKDEVERMFRPGFLPGVDDYVDSERA